MSDIAPEFDQLRERLRVVAWFSNAGQNMPTALPFPHRNVGSVAAAKEEIERPEWEEWTLERGNDTTSFLDARFPNRYAQWNKVVRMAKSFLQEIEPVLLPALSFVLPSSKVAVDAVRWDLMSALMEAAYADCRPPLFFTYLVTVYEAGHLPVGWDPSGDVGTLLVY